MLSLVAMILYLDTIWASFDFNFLIFPILATLLGVIGLAKRIKSRKRRKRRKSERKSFD